MLNSRKCSKFEEKKSLYYNYYQLSLSIGNIFISGLNKDIFRAWIRMHFNLFEQKHQNFLKTCFPNSKIKIPFVWKMTLKKHL